MACAIACFAVFWVENHLFPIPARSWKPHLIRRTLADNGAMASGDVLLYSDAMNKIRQPPRDYVQWAGRNGTCAFQMVRGWENLM